MIFGSGGVDGDTHSGSRRPEVGMVEAAGAVVANSTSPVGCALLAAGVTEPGQNRPATNLWTGGSHE